MIYRGEPYAPHLSNYAGAAGGRVFPSAAGFQTSQTFFTDDEGVYVLEMRDAPAFSEREDNGSLGFEDFVDKRTLMRTVRLVQRQSKQRPPTPNPLSFIPRYLSELYHDDKIELEVQTTIDDMVSKLNDEDLDSPNSDAAALIWMAGEITNHSKTQKEVGKVAGVTEVTIRNRYKPKKKKLGLNIGQNRNR